jgi:hypothetical protein
VNLEKWQEFTATIQLAEEDGVLEDSLALYTFASDL